MSILIDHYLMRVMIKDVLKWLQGDNNQEFSGLSENSQIIGQYRSVKLSKCFGDHFNLKNSIKQSTIAVYYKVNLKKKKKQNQEKVPQPKFKTKKQLGELRKPIPLILLAVTVSFSLVIFCLFFLSCYQAPDSKLV